MFYIYISTFRAFVSSDSHALYLRKFLIRTLIAAQLNVNGEPLHSVW
jgi:hypothetical protein